MSEVNIDNDFSEGFLRTSTTAARTLLPNGQETATPVDTYTVEFISLVTRGLLRTATGIITIVIAGTVTIDQGL